MTCNLVLLPMIYLLYQVDIGGGSFEKIKAMRWKAMEGKPPGGTSHLGEHSETTPSVFSECIWSSLVVLEMMKFLEVVEE